MKLKTVYHVTTVKNYNKIKVSGLKLAIGNFSEKYGEDSPAIYTFVSLDELDNALLNWLGDEYSDLEEEMGGPIDLAILEVSVGHLNLDTKVMQDGSAFYEQKINSTIEPEFIKLVRIEESDFLVELG